MEDVSLAEILEGKQTRLLISDPRRFVEGLAERGPSSHFDRR